MYISKTYSMATLKLPNLNPKKLSITAITNAINRCVHDLRAIDIAYLNMGVERVSYIQKDI